MRPGEAQVFLQPGQLWLDDTPALVKTILGSCLAITMRAQRLGLAAVTHCLLPSAGGLARLTRAETLKYVDATVGLLFEIFALRGASLADLEVKLVGGADNLLANGPPNRYSVGSRNVQVALAGLAQRGIRPAAAIVGGRAGRVMVFDAGTGDVFVKLLSTAPRRSGADGAGF